MRQNGDTDEQRQRREEALHTLADQQPATTPQTLGTAALDISRALPPLSSQRRRVRPTIVALLIISLLIGGGLGWWRLSQSARQTAGGPVVLKYPDAHIVCPFDVTWSPDAKRVAVLGNSWCPNQKPNAAVPLDPQLLIFDAATWRLVETIHLNPLAATVRPLVVIPRLRGDQASLAAISVGADSPVTWSPDHQQVALSVSLDASKLFATGGSSAAFWSGLLLVNVGTQTAVRATVQPLLPDSSIPTPA
ncbi:MAG: hypothetical protein IVW57_20010, partial [Ktedonobacterales bacterium]|nr:hypothetical protein [Ktedonobacterales bacterium]